jgi:hypothetical protein
MSLRHSESYQERMEVPIPAVNPYGVSQSTQSVMSGQGIGTEQKRAKLLQMGKFEESDATDASRILTTSHI